MYYLIYFSIFVLQFVT